MGKKEFHTRGAVWENDPLNGIKVINGRVQCVATVPASPRIGPGPIKIKGGVASHGEVVVTSAGALRVVQG
jgi:hypothetical protein